MPDRCCAHSRANGRPCAAKAMKNGRCRNHGGMSTGVKTQEGRERISAAQKRRWEAWRAANGRSISSGNGPQDQLLKMLAKLSPTDRFLRDAMKPAVTPWTITTPRPTVAETRPARGQAPAVCRCRRDGGAASRSELRAATSSVCRSQSIGSPTDARSLKRSDGRCPTSRRNGARLCASRSTNIRSGKSKREPISSD